MSIFGLVLTIVASAVAIYFQYMKDKSTANSPEQRAKNDEQKVNNAIADGDITIINDAFNELHKNRDTFGDNGK